MYFSFEQSSQTICLLKMDVFFLTFLSSVAISVLSVIGRFVGFMRSHLPLFACVQCAFQSPIQNAIITPDVSMCSI